MNYIMVLIINFYFLILFHYIFIVKADKKRLALKFTSGRRFMIYFSTFIAYFAILGRILNLIDNESLKNILYFASLVSGVGGFAIGGEKFLSKSGGNK